MPIRTLIVQKEKYVKHGTQYNTKTKLKTGFRSGNHNVIFFHVLLLSIEKKIDDYYNLFLI